MGIQVVKIIGIMVAMFLAALVLFSPAIVGLIDILHYFWRSSSWSVVTWDESRFLIACVMTFAGVFMETWLYMLMIGVLRAQ